MNIVILTEANPKVATGHLMESIELSEALEGQGYEISMLVNDSCPAELRRRITCCCKLYRQDTETGLSSIRDWILEKNPDVLVTDLRKADQNLIRKVRAGYHGKIICIDELGHRELQCDVIINPMAGSYFWVYQTELAEMYFGAEYLILPGKIAQYHKAPKNISDKIGQVTVSMGGVDIEATTLKLLRWLPEILPDAAVDIIVGGGFPYQRQAEELIEELCLQERMHLYRNADNIYDFFYRADLAFCAGGNTLHELSCIGTPAIVIPMMPHEWDNGQVFEKAGFGKCLRLSREVTREELAKAVEEMKDTAKRSDMSAAGRRFSDGRGCERVVRIIRRQLQ